MKKTIFLSVLLAVGCATLDNNSLDWIPIGPEFHATDPAVIEVVSSRKEITRAYGTIGLLRVRNLKPGRDSLKYGVERGRKFIAGKGADAMLLGQYNSAAEGDLDPRVTLVIYAIKYMDTMTEKDQKAIEDFEVLGILDEQNIE